MKNAFVKESSTTKQLPGSTVSIARVLGLGCYLAWVFMLFYMTKAHPIGIALRDMLYLNQVLSTLALGVGLLVIALIAARSSRFTLKRRMIVAGVAVMFLGSVCIIFNRLNPFGHAESIFILSGLLTGFGSSVLLASWGMAIIPCTARTRLVECALAFSGALFNAFILNFLPDTFTLLLILATPIASGALAIYSRKRTPELTLTPLPSEERPVIHKLVMRAGVAALSFGLVAGFMDVLSGYRIFAVGEYYDAVLLCIAGLCSLFILGIGMFIKRDALIMCYRAAIFLAILGCMTTPFMEDGNTYPNAIIAGSYIAIQIVVFGLCGTFVKKYGFSPLRCFCTGFCTLYLSEGLGLIGGMIATAFIPESHTVLLGITIFLAACLLFSYLFLFTERDFINNHLSFSHLENGNGSSQPGAIGVGSQELHHQFAQEFGLTSREVDVFCLVTQGRSNTRIQEELFISSGTVSTHINHIYRKCGVSNKQELLDIVEERQRVIFG